ncbi:hypothetical protein [Neisseria sicca]|nr:hypothetical protein [Neisseria sicca]
MIKKRSSEKFSDDLSLSKICRSDTCIRQNLPHKAVGHLYPIKSLP